MVQIAHDTRFPDPGTVGGYIVASLTLLFVRVICTSNICAASRASDRQHRSTHSFLPSLCSLILNGHRRSSREGLVHCPAASAGLTDGFVPALVPTCFPWSKDALIRSILTASAQTVRESVHITAVQRHSLNAGAHHFSLSLTTPYFLLSQRTESTPPIMVDLEIVEEP